MRGPKGVRGPTGFGYPGQKGARGLPGQPGGGVSYTRWGKSSCPGGTSLVYAGRITGTHNNHGGGGADMLCLSNVPQHLRYTPGIQSGRSYLYGAQYQTGGRHSYDTGPFSGVSQQNAPCAVCYSSLKGDTIMIPGQTVCPPSWTREYYGYLMSSHYDHKRLRYECFDWNPDTVPGQASDNEQLTLYHVEVMCQQGHGIACPPYVAGREITCVVCSR